MMSLYARNVLEMVELYPGNTCSQVIRRFVSPHAYEIMKGDLRHSQRRRRSPTLEFPMLPPMALGPLQSKNGLAPVPYDCGNNAIDTSYRVQPGGIRVYWVGRMWKTQKHSPRGSTARFRSSGVQSLGYFFSCI